MKSLRYELTAGIIYSSIFIAPFAMAQVGNSPYVCPRTSSDSTETIPGNAVSTPTPTEATRSPVSTVAGMPRPECESPPVTTIAPENDRISVKLNNTTNATVTYQVIGNTAPRPLTGRQETILRDLPLPTTITLIREDSGLLKVQPMKSPSGMLEVNLDEKVGLDDVQGTIRIQRNGNVYVY